MKECSNCGKRVYGREPDNAEYGTPAVDGRQYPEECPRCGQGLG